jgi:signal peptidase I
MGLEVIDPFYWFDKFWFKYIGKPKTISEKSVYFLGEVVYSIFLAYTLYYILSVALSTPRPAVIVASGSMIPTLHVGDIAIVRGVPPQDIRAPEVDLDMNVFGKPLEELPIKLVYDDNGVLRAMDVNGTVVPYEKNGDIIVYFNNVVRKDIIHRAVLKIHAKDGWFFLTKGDNDSTNPTLDQDCHYGPCVYVFPVPYKFVLGRVIGVIPYIGKIKLLLLGA